MKEIAQAGEYRQQRRQREHYSVFFITTVTQADEDSRRFAVTMEENTCQAILRYTWLTMEFTTSSLLDIPYTVFVRHEGTGKRRHSLELHLNNRFIRRLKFYLDEFETPADDVSPSTSEILNLITSQPPPKLPTPSVPK